MKPYHKVLGISIIVLLAGIVVFVSIAYRTDQLFFIVASIILLALASITTLMLLFSYKNRLLRRLFLFGMPVCLLLYCFGYFLRIPEIPVLSFGFLIYFVGINLVLHFMRFDLNLIIVTFLIILGMMFKRYHFVGGGVILTIASFLIAFFSVVNAVRAFRSKDNRYLSVVIFSCCLVLAIQSMAFLWKIQHMPGAGILTQIGLPLFIIATLIILLTLPGSNFIEWTRNQKKILLRGLLIPWLFFMYIVAVALFSPRQFDIFFFLRSQQQEQVHFYMEDYPVENRNGLE